MTLPQPLRRYDADMERGRNRSIEDDLARRPQLLGPNTYIGKQAGEFVDYGGWAVNLAHPRFRIDPDGVIDSQSGVMDAIARAVSVGVRRVYAPAGYTILCNDQVAAEDDEYVDVVGGYMSVFKKNFNGALFSLGLRSRLHGFRIDGNGAAGRTGQGVVIESGSGGDGRQRIVDLDIYNTIGPCIEFTEPGAGWGAIIRGCHLEAYNLNAFAIKFADDDDNGPYTVEGCFGVGPLIDLADAKGATIFGCTGGQGGTKTITGVAATDVVTSTAHGLANGDPIWLATGFSGGAGLSAVPYWLRDVTTDTFKLAAYLGGPVVDFTSNITAGTIYTLPSLRMSDGVSKINLSGCTFDGAVPIIIRGELGVYGNNIFNGGYILGDGAASNDIRGIRGTVDHGHFDFDDSGDVSNDIHGWLHTYTPTWSAATTPPSIGNGTLAGSWQRQGRAVALNMRFLAGSTTTYGTGFWSFSLPLGVPAPAVNSAGPATLFVAGTQYPAHVTISASGIIVFYGSPSTAVNSGGPAMWASGDAFEVAVQYMLA